MNKFIKIITGICVPVIAGFISMEWSNLSDESIFLGIVSFIICAICSYLANENEKQESSKEKICKENENLRTKILEDKNKFDMEYQKLKYDNEMVITELKRKLSELAINLNGNCPYIIQIYINTRGNALKKGHFYDVEVLVSTVSKDYDLKYINVRFNENVIIEQSTYYKSSGAILNKNTPVLRCGNYEYSFINNNFIDNSVIKCVFKIKCNTICSVNMVAEVINSESSTRLEAAKELNFK